MFVHKSMLSGYQTSRLTFSKVYHLSHWHVNTVSWYTFCFKCPCEKSSRFRSILWGCAAKSNVAVIQRHQSKLLRTITNAPWYVPSHTLHFDLHIPHVRTVFRERTAAHRTALDSHPNPLMEPLVHPPNTRRLKQRWTFDEIHQGKVAGCLLDHRQLGQRIGS